MATEIHATAVIADGAEIGSDCRIGPYCIIGPHVRIDTGTHLQPHVVIDGNTRIGKDCEIFSFACLGKQTQDLKYRGGEGPLEIGDRTTIREFVTAHLPTVPESLTRIGNDCHILAYSHIAHDCLLGNHIIMSNSTHLAGHVTVEDHVVFGGLCGVHQFVKIGTMAMIGATSKVIQDIAPYALVDGNPALPVTVNKVGMQRNGLDEETVRAVVQAHRIIFRSKLSLQDAVLKLQAELAEVPQVMHIVEFIRGAERGLARPKKA